uniref:Uncharacterized protein n=1 Tax=Coccidioides posadasii RMSCC 3488 TaxID=454284 RepID=A0A0J6FQ35_COCPO|nr:hypothetical protein CPAG_07881 [Coccidioides posadasii RMSCC 3488]
MSSHTDDQLHNLIQNPKLAAEKPMTRGSASVRSSGYRCNHIIARANESSSSSSSSSLQVAFGSWSRNSNKLAHLVRALQNDTYDTGGTERPPADSQEAAANVDILFASNSNVESAS